MSHELSAISQPPASVIYDLLSYKKCACKDIDGVVQYYSMTDRSVGKGVWLLSTDKQQRILQAAWKVFASRGYAAAKMSDIAAEAGVAKGTIYLYFTSKEQLYTALLRKGMQRIETRVLEEVNKCSAPTAKLKAFMAAHLQQVVSHKPQAKLLLGNLTSGMRMQFAAVLRELALQYLGHLERIIIDGQQAGRFRCDLSPRLTAQCIIGGLNFLTHVILEKVEEDDADRNPDQQDLLELAFQLFCLGLYQREVKHCEAN